MPKQITDDPQIIAEILDQAEVLWLALADDQGPHCVPVNFGRIGETLYIHSGKKGRKAAALNTGAPLAFSTAVDVRMREGGDDACDQGYLFKSIMGSGTPRIVEGDEKLKGLDALTVKHLGRQLPYKEKVIPITEVYAIDVTAIHARVKESKE